LRYAIVMNRRVELQDVEDRLQRQTWYLAPDRYQELFLAGAFSPEPLTIAGRDVEEVVDDIDELDRYFEQLENKRTTTGAMVMDALRKSDEEGWV
jgi:ribosomal protein S3AE